MAAASLISPIPRRLGRFKVGPVAFCTWRFTSPVVAIGRESPPSRPARWPSLSSTQRPDRLGASLTGLDVELDRQEVCDVIQASEGVALP